MHRRFWNSCVQVFFVFGLFLGVVHARPKSVPSLHDRFLDAFRQNDSMTLNHLAARLGISAIVEMLSASDETLQRAAITAIPNLEYNWQALPILSTLVTDDKPRSALALVSARTLVENLRHDMFLALEGTEEELTDAINAFVALATKSDLQREQRIEAGVIAIELSEFAEALSLGN